jgi:hypothetical protein
VATLESEAMTLVWTRTRDGEHNSKPVYEYDATCDDRAYHIVWAYDRGFGISAYRRLKDGKNENIGDRFGIAWCGSLKNCKAAAERLERQHGTQT